jgi:hypothetical protein
VSVTTLTIGASERDALHGLMLHRLFVLGEEPIKLARAEGVSIEQLGEEFGEDLRLMQDLGWLFESDSEAVELTMPVAELVRTLKRLRRDARRAPCEERREREPKESDDERWQRFRRGVEVCEALLTRLDDPADRGEAKRPSEDACPASSAAGQELGPYAPVDDVLILAAAERAVLHEQEEAVLTYVLTEHLGFEAVPETNKHLWPRLEELRRAGLLTVAERRGEPFWGLTKVARERLEAEREADRVDELPESPQHRAWRHARVEAAVRIEGFKEELILATEEADRLINQYRPVMSEEWFELSERLRWDSWRLASATYCLTEWPEPDDAMPDPDENPGPHPGRRTTSAWNPSTESKERT